MGATGNEGSTVTTTYTRRGTVDQVTSSYGLLVDHVTRDADGLVKEIQYGDAAETTTAFTYDDLRRLRNLTTYRASLDGWSSASGTQQMLLQDEEYSYDRVGNPVEIRDWRDPEEWLAGSKPVTKKMRYDSLYRLSRIDYQYGSGADDWVDPYAAEVLDNLRPQPAPRAKFAQGERVQWQTYAYDWLGNTADTRDDQHAFYDRSLGTVTNDGYKLASAESQVGARQGELTTQYDSAGNLVSMDVSRGGTCTVLDGCTDQHYEYEWDEVGRLVRARRDAAADLSFSYDASDQRVRKTSGSRHTLYVFGSVELRYAQHDGTDYALNESTEVPYLFANGVRLARVVKKDATTHVFLELGDHLGSTSVVLDRATGELVERTTAYAYGGVESDYRPAGWESFREDYRFTGKEDDVEVGLIYFGKRFYAPLLQRWISPDPLAIHAPGEADLNLHAYVHGRVLVAVDPVGLEAGTATQPWIPVWVPPSVAKVAKEIAEAAPELAIVALPAAFVVVATIHDPESASKGGPFHSNAGDTMEAKKEWEKVHGTPTRSSGTEADQARMARVKRNRAKEARKSGEVADSAPADPNGGSGPNRTKTPTPDEQDDKKPTDPDVKTKAGDSGGSTKNVKRNIEVPDRKPTAGEKKQQKRDARKKGQAKAETKKGKREHTANARGSTYQTHTDPRAGGAEKKDKRMKK